MRRFRFLGVLVAVLGFSAPAHARKMVFAETWQNGTSNWRTHLANGGDCKGWPTCPFTPAIVKPAFPAGLMSNDILVRDHNGAGNRDVNVCNGQYVHIPVEYAGWDAGNYVATGGVNVAGTQFNNTQFPVQPGDKVCMVAWIRAYADNQGEAGPYIGINYTGPHGVVDAGHNHGTHFVIGSMATDPADGNGWVNTPRNSYGAMTQVNKDGQWHRYKASFMVDSKDTSGPRDMSPEFQALNPVPTWATTDAWEASGGTAKNHDYAQPRLLLFGKNTVRLDSQSYSYLPPVMSGADFGDVYAFKSDAAEDPCPTEAELDAMLFASDKTACGTGTVCKQRTVALPAGDCSDRNGGAPARCTPAFTNNNVYYCAGCSSSFGAAPSDTTCTATKPFCNDIGMKGGTCTPCAGDASSAAAANVRCAATNPTCMTVAGDTQGSCGKCADDTACVNDSGSAAHVGPSCNKDSGACFSCLTDFGVGDAGSACTAAAPVCDTATGHCGTCTDNTQCAGGSAHGGPFCDAVSGSCVTCQADFGAEVASTTCPEGTPHCNVGNDSAGVCGKCTQNSDCANGDGSSTHGGPLCNVDTGLCAKCDGDAEVSQSAYGCKAGAPTCGASGACSKCGSDDDCKNPDGTRLHAKSKCDHRAGVCVGPPAAVTLSGTASENGNMQAGSGGSCSTTSANGLSGAPWFALALGLMGVGARKRRRAS